MERNRDGYTSPLSTRYASKEMQYLFSDNNKFRTWRKLWIALAKAEHQLGLNVSQEQIRQLEAHAEEINYDVAEAREKLVRHDVMSHVYAYGRQCPDAEAIIHLGATSCYVGDNTDILILREPPTWCCASAPRCCGISPPLPGSIRTCPAWPTPTSSPPSSPPWASGPPCG